MCCRVILRGSPVFNGMVLLPRPSMEDAFDRLCRLPDPFGKGVTDMRLRLLAVGQPGAVWTPVTADYELDEFILRHGSMGAPTAVVAMLDL